MMRLIDADELGYTLTEGLKCAMCVNPMHTDRGCDGNCMIPNPLLLNALEKYIADGINNQKTVDAVPVRHGNWVEVDKDGYQCSKCESSVWSIYEFKSMAEKYKRFCPVCGATMMDGDEYD